MKRWLGFGVAFAVGIAAACGGTNSNFGDAGDDAQPPGDGGGGDVVNPFGDAQSKDGGGCFKCSADLHSVLDCNDNVVTTCPQDQGCGAGGTCVPACDSASANQSSIGCEYWAVTPDGWSNIPEYNAGTSDGSCFAAFVTNTWGSPVTVTLEYNGQTINGGNFAYLPQGTGTSITYQKVSGGQIPADQMAIVFLAQYGSSQMYKTLCPTGTQAAITNVDTGVHGTGTGHAIRIATSAPTVVYDIYPYGGAISYITSATLLLPTSVWDTNYVAATTWDVTSISGLARPSGVTIVANQDGTQVTISPTAAITARGSVAGTGQGVPHTYDMNRGDILHFMQTADLTGSPLQSNFPIGVWGQHYCMNIPSGVAACDPGHQELPPVKALGSEYVAVRYRTRATTEESVPWRFVGAVDGTTLTYDPPQSGAPTTLSSGQLVEWTGPGPFAVKSQDDKHPFYLAAHMTGGSAAGVQGGMGDPETVNLIPPQQYLADYIFFTDPTYSETNVVLVRKKNAQNAFDDVTLDCAGTLTGWTDIGSGAYQYTRVDLQKGHAKVGNCDNGRHEAKSATPFGETVWGWDSYVSYGYPAGASVKPINSVVVPPVPK
jgi:hypothetical protein